MTALDDVQFELNLALEFGDFERAERMQRIKDALRGLELYRGDLSAQGELEVMRTNWLDAEERATHPTVRPLVWEEAEVGIFNRQYLRAASAGVEYTLSPFLDSGKWLYSCSWEESERAHLHPTLEKARAAAEADHQELILSALT